MMKRKKLLVWLVLIATVVTSFPILADLTVGVFPRRSAAITVKSFKPLVKHLSEVLGENVKLEVSKNFSDFWKNMEAGKYDIVHYNQYHYIKSHAEKKYNVIVTNEELGNNQIAGLLSVRTDSGIDSVEDLRGKKILFGGGRKAMASYIATTAILKKHGLVEGNDYEAMFAKNPPSAVIGVYNKAADAAGSGNIILKVKVVSSKIDVTQMKGLAESESFIHLVWAVKGDMDAGKAERITDAMTSLQNSDAGKAILKAARVTGFAKTNDDQFAKVREIVEYAIGEKY